VTPDDCRDASPKFRASRVWWAQGGTTTLVVVLGRPRRLGLDTTTRAAGEDDHMGFVNGIWLALLGVLAASNLIIAKKPDAKELIGKLAPYQGWMGAVSVFWGVWTIVGAVLNLGWLGHFPIYWATWLGDGVLLAALGLLLGVGVLKTFIKDPTANEKMDQTITKLAPYQGTLGLVAIGLGVWMTVAGVIWKVG
jgi:hypothetical protein